MTTHLPMSLEIDLRMSARTIQNAHAAVVMPAGTDIERAKRSGTLSAHVSILAEELARAHAYIMQATQTEDSVGDTMTSTPTWLQSGNADLAAAT